MRLEDGVAKRHVWMGQQQQLNRDRREGDRRDDARPGPAPAQHQETHEGGNDGAGERQTPRHRQVRRETLRQCQAHDDREQPQDRQAGK